MPQYARQSEEKPSVTSYGQVIEYIKDRLFLASYTHPPDEKTPFPYPQKSSSRRSPHKRSSQAQPDQQSSAPTLPPFYFTVDDSLLYNPFYADFGPLHIGHLYRFAVQLHDVLGNPEYQHRPIVFWSNADSRSRANAACILATYMIMIQSWPPHLVLAPITQMDPPCMPFRDAGYSQADYALTIQDVVYGVWKAKEEGLVGVRDFCLEEYEKYERVDQGDFNWISPDFLAFASPQHQPTHIITPADPLFTKLPRSTAAVMRDESLPQPFKNVLCHFSERGIGLVVRLNSELYSPSYFSALGIKHLDMIFDDGTCPPLNLVRKFVNLAHIMINDKKKGIAVHCKAGLGRTGCLIGAYLIYRYGFTANEVIAYMRFMRPGMVVGPQQHWLHLNQGTFREWWFEDTMREKIMASAAPATPTRLQHSGKRLTSNSQSYTPPGQNQQNVSPRRALGEITNNEASPVVNGSHASPDDSKAGTVGVADENLPAPTPGQPRKTNKSYGGRRIMTENQPFDIKPDTEIVSAQRTRIRDGVDGEEDYAMHLLSRKTGQSPISRSGKRRAVSCTTTTTTTTKWDVPTDTSDSENRPDTGGENEAAVVPSPTRPKTPASRSGNGMGSLSVSKRSSAVRRSTEGKTSVRKTSGRVGSAGTQNARSHKAS